MKRFNQFFTVIFIILCSLLVSSTSYAIPLSFEGVDPYEIASTNAGGVYAGIYNLEVGEDAVAYDSFCIDFYQHIYQGTFDNYKFESLNDIFPSSTHPDVADYIAELWFDNYSNAMNNSQVAAGLQIAIWEVTIDINHDVSNGNFFISSGSNYGAQEMLEKLDGEDFASLTAITNSKYQDFVIGNQPVPEPASMLLFGTGIIGLAAFTRRKLYFKK